MPWRAPFSAAWRTAWCKSARNRCWWYGKAAGNTLYRILAMQGRKSVTVTSATTGGKARFMKRGPLEAIMKRILVGVDGSQEAAAAAEKAADLAQATGAKLQLVYVVPSRPPRGPAEFVVESQRWELVERNY